MAPKATPTLPPTAAIAPVPAKLAKTSPPNTRLPRCKLKPSEYVKRGNIFFAVEVEESALPLAAHVANENALIWASDYPHERDQRDFSRDIPNLINRKDVSDELKRKIFWDNPLRFYPRLKSRVEKADSRAVA